MLRFSDDALHCITEWQHSNADLCRNSNNSQLVAVYKKLEIYAIRFSLIMAIMDYATKGASLLEKGNIKILPPHVKAAIGITEYFRGSAKKILSFKPNTKSLKNTNQRFIDFFEKLPPRFPTGQAREIGKELQLSERQVYYYLDSEYFKPIKRGFYKKNYKFV